jgi:hypothetical protein
MYYDNATGMVSEKRPEDIFVVKNLYRDTINNSDNPAQIENNLSRFEGEASKIIKKLHSDGEIIISCEEEEKLKIFLAIMGFRSQNVHQTFSQNDEDYRNYYSFFQEDGNLTDFWKRNLGELVKCRSINEVMNNHNIDDPIRLFILRDTIGLSGTYLMLIERRGAKDFLLSDCYPLVIEGTAANGLKLQECFIFPISPMRAIMLVYRGVEYASKSAVGFDNDFFKEPIMLRDGKNLSIRISKIYEPSVTWINKMIIDNTSAGIVFQEKNSRDKY